MAMAAADSPVENVQQFVLGGRVSFVQNAVQKLDKKSGEVAVEVLDGGFVVLAHCDVLHQLLDHLPFCIDTKEDKRCGIR